MANASRAMSLVAIVLLLLFLAACGGAPIVNEVKTSVSPTTTPSSAQPGTAVSVTVSGFPDGPVTASSVTVTLTLVQSSAASQAAAPCSSTPPATVTVAATEVTGSGANREVKFKVPDSINPCTATTYEVSISGTMQSGRAFVATNRSRITILPAPSIVSVAPNTGAAGTFLDVIITGANTNFVQGQTQANFGSGIAVSDPQYDGVFQNVTVLSTTSARARVIIRSTATTGPRTVQVKVGEQVLSLANGFTVTPANRNPVANVGGPYSGTAGRAISFSGTGSSDPDGDTLTFAWTFGDGGSGSGATPTHTYAAAGTYTVSLTVTDGRGGSATANTTATVIPSNLPPVASAGGPYTGQTGTAITFSAAGSSDPDGDTLSFSWNFGDGNTATGVSPTHTYTTAGTFTVTVTVSDGKGATATASTTAEITARPNQAPTANAGGPYTGNVNQVITFSSAGSTDPDGDPLTFSWAFSDSTTATGASPTKSFSAAGNYSVTLTVSDGRGGTATAQAQITITAPPSVSITSPVVGALFRTPTITVEGTVDPVTATVTVNGVNAVVAGTGQFTAEVPLREGQNLITATAANANNEAGTATVSVTLDLTAPSITIESPAANSTVTANQVTVTGMVNDIVTGTVNAEQVTVKVNGVDAVISNRSFAVADLLLVRGVNTINAVATDRAGNTATATVRISVEDTATQQRIIAVSGNNQSGEIGATLAEPLMVQLLDNDDLPVAGRAVTFTVSRSDGRVKALPEEGQEITVISDDQGRASVLFQLGSRTGVGVNEVRATSSGFVGDPTFSATSAGAPPVSITVVHGENQRGVIGQPLASPFEVIVTDRGGNPVSAVQVTFTVDQGGGTLDSGQTVVTKATNSDGRASVLLTLGQQEGTNNNVVTVNFEGNPASPLTFTASGLSQGSIDATRVSGVVLDNSQRPIPNATARIAGTTLSAVTDAQGRFTINNAPVGTVTLTIDGSTSTLPETYPFLSFVLQSLAGQDNTLNQPIYLPAIDTENSKMVGGAEEVVLTMKDMPGVAFRVAPNSATFPDGTKVGRLSISQVHADKVPMAPPNGASPRVVWTLQPAGTKFDPPIQVQLPNSEGLAAGQVVELFQFDHDLEQFVSVGTARVSGDGSVMTSDTGFGITKGGWGAAAPPPPPRNCTISCDDGNVCTADSKVDPCSCSNRPSNEGGRCGGAATGADSCRDPGVCQGGSCTGRPKPDASACDDGQFCTENDKCEGGACKGTKVPDGPVESGTIEVNLKPILDSVENLARRLGFAETFTVTISEELKNQNKCCEVLQRRDVPTREFKYSLNAKLETPKIFPPQFRWHVINAGPFIKFGASVSAGLGGSKDFCSTNPKMCWGGSVGASATIEGGLAVEDAAKFVSVSVSIQGGVQAELAVTCEKITGKIGSTDVKFKGTAEFFDGYISVGYERVLFPAADLGNFDIPLPGGN